MEKMQKVCMNCNTLLYGKFCSECGQNSCYNRVNWSYLVYDILHFLHLDFALIRTLTNLLFRTDRTVSEYLNGKRTLFYSPLGSVIMVAGLYTFVYKIGFIEPLNVIVQMLYLLDGYENNILHYPSWFVDYYAVFELLVLIPIFSLASFLIFSRDGYSFAEHFVINAYLSAQRMLVSVLFFPVLFLFRDYEHYNYLSTVVASLEFGITFLGFANIYKLHFLPIRLALILITFLSVLFVFGIIGYLINLNLF